MAGRVLSRKEEGGNLWQQPVIAQGLSGVGVPATLGLLLEYTLPHKQPILLLWNLAGKPCWKGDGHTDASLDGAAGLPRNLQWQ